MSSSLSSSYHDNASSDDDEYGPPPPGMGGSRGGCEATAEDAALQAPTPPRDANGDLLVLDSVLSAPPFTLEPTLIGSDLEDEASSSMERKLANTVSIVTSKVTFIVPWDGIFEPRCLSPVMVDGTLYEYPSGSLWADAHVIVCAEESDDICCSRLSDELLA